MKFYFKLSLRELWGHRRISGAVIFNLVLGLTGLLTISLFKTSVENSIAANSREYLGADLSVSSRRALSPEEVRAVAASLPEGSQISHARELYTTLGTEGDARLVQLRAHEPSYPFYGSMEKEGGGAGPEEIFSGSGAWIYPELRAQLGLDVGDTIRLGQSEVEITGVVLTDKASASANLSLAPSIYIGAKTLDETGLLQKGSLVRHSYLALVPPQSDLEQLKLKLESSLPEHDVRVSTHRESSERSYRAILYLSDYLSLISLVALFLALLGTTYILRTYLQKRAATFGLFKALGLSGPAVQKLFFVQMMMMGLIAGATSLLLSFAVASILVLVLQDVLGPSFALSFDALQLSLLVVMIFLITFLLALPYSDRLRGLKISHLFRESWESHFEVTARTALLWVPAVAGLVGLTFFLTRSGQLTAVFLVSLTVSFLILVMAGWFLFRGASRWLRQSWAWNQALKFLDRERYSTLAAFAALSLGLALVTMAFQLERGLVREISLPGAEERPGLFLFDLQDEQIEDFNRFVQARNVTPLHVAPMIRARLRSVNGTPFEKDTESESFSTREADRERSMRNRGFNLTYQGPLQSSQKIVAGTWEESFSDEMPAISVEKKFAERLGFELGDVLVFDVQGVEIPGKVVSFRRVNWGSFQPNFFVTFQPGVLEPAPKTYVITLPEIEDKAQFQAELVAEFPNVSSVDVKRTLDRLLGLVDSMAGSFRLMAFLTLLAGLGVFFSILQFRFSQRSKDLVLLRAVGASAADLRRLVFYETAWMGAGSSAFGIAVGMILSILPSKIIFDGMGAPPPWFFWLLPFLIVFFGQALAALWTGRVLARSRGLEPLR